MAEGEHSETGKRAVPAFLDLVAGAFVAVAVDRMLKDGLSSAILPAAIGIAIFLTGLNWRSVSARFGRRFSETATSVATDFRWWLVVILVAFLYVGFPIFKGTIDGSFARREDVRGVSEIALSSKPSQADTTSQSKPGKRIFVGFGPKYLMDIYKKNSAAESEAILKLYTGKWMKITNERFSGAIRDYPEIGDLTHDHYVVASVKIAGDYVVMCKIRDESQMETAMTLQPGSTISFVGMIAPQQLMLGAILSLDPCELT